MGASIRARPAVSETPLREPSSRGADSTSRTRLLESHVALVETLRASGVRTRKLEEGFSPVFQVCLPYRGLFVWHVGGEEVVGDGNQVLFVSAGESFYLSQPLVGDYAELIITPDMELLTSLAHAHDGSLSGHPLFRRRSRRAGFALQHLRSRFLQDATDGGWNPLRGEECVVRILRAALEPAAPRREPSQRTRRLVSRTKAFLEAYLASPLRLADIAQAVGASPAYLTDVFRRVEGLPLHGYLTELRLARSLVELPHATDLTTLALSLGFSSHSHFTATFRRAYGCSPSQFRASTSRNRKPAARRRSFDKLSA